MMFSIEALPLWILYAGLLWLIIAPGQTLLHELGHAAAALLLSDAPVTVVLGDYRQHESNPRKVDMQTGRLRYVLQPLSGFTGFYIWSRDESSRRTRIIVNLAGPVTSLLIALLLWYLDTALQVDALSPLLYWSGILAFWQFVFTILPIRYPRWMGAYQGRISDGRRVYRLLTPDINASTQED